jgi:hypothetical protein
MKRSSYDLLRRLEALGFTFEEARQLRRIEMTLRRWREAECNGDIQRDETTGKPYRQYGNGSGPFQTCSVADRERGALKRLAKIMTSHPDFIAYHQGDPRGCALYILAKKDVRRGEDVSAVYNRGLAVCA